VYSNGHGNKIDFCPIDHYFNDLLDVIHLIGFWTGKIYRKLICGEVEHHGTSLFQRLPNYFSFLEGAENDIEEKAEPLN
jgi:hypothetical protein